MDILQQCKKTSWNVGCARSIVVRNTENKDACSEIDTPPSIEFLYRKWAKDDTVTVREVIRAVPRILRAGWVVPAWPQPLRPHLNKLLCLPSVGWRINAALQWGHMLGIFVLSVPAFTKVTLEVNLQRNQLTSRSEVISRCHEDCLITEECHSNFLNARLTLWSPSFLLVSTISWWARVKVRKAYRDFGGKVPAIGIFRSSSPWGRWTGGGVDWTRPWRHNSRGR